MWLKFIMLLLINAQCDKTTYITTFTEHHFKATNPPKTFIHRFSGDFYGGYSAQDACCKFTDF